MLNKLRLNPKHLSRVESRPHSKVSLIRITACMYLSARKEKKCHPFLQGETPGGVQRGAEVDDAVRVGAHEVDHLSDAEPTHLRGRESHCVPVHCSRHRRADFEPQLAHEEVEVGVAQSRDQRGPG